MVRRLAAGGASHERTRLGNKSIPEAFWTIKSQFWHGMGGVTSELVSGIRRRASIWHFIPAPRASARTRARAAARIPPLKADLPPRPTRLRSEIPEPSGGFNVQTGLARVRPGSNAPY